MSLDMSLFWVLALSCLAVPLASLVAWLFFPGAFGDGIENTAETSMGCKRKGGGGRKK